MLHSSGQEQEEIPWGLWLAKEIPTFSLFPW
jgi:hypothetical protein